MRCQHENARCDPLKVNNTDASPNGAEANWEWCSMIGQNMVPDLSLERPRIDTT